MDLDVGVATFTAILCQCICASVFWLISFNCLAILTPFLVSLLIFLGGISSVSMRPLLCRALSIWLHHCSVMPTCLAMSLFCDGPLSKRVIKIFCLTVRSMRIYG